MRTYPKAPNPTYAPILNDARDRPSPKRSGRCVSSTAAFTSAENTTASGEKEKKKKKKEGLVFKVACVLPRACLDK